MTFILKKFLSSLLLPLPISLLLCLVGLLLWLAHQRKWAGSFITLAFLLLLTFSLSYPADLLLNGLESQYAPMITLPQHVDNIIVLGGGVGGQFHYPANTRLNSASLSRLVEGIRLYRELRHQGTKAKLILSGGRVFRSPVEAGRMRNTAIILGVDPQALSIENGSRDTWEEALYLKPKLNSSPFILVTSAYHMPRAMQIFTQLGMHPLPAPTQYLMKLNHNPFRKFIPSSVNLLYSDIALHEYVGLLWNKWQNRTHNVS